MERIPDMVEELASTSLFRDIPKHETAKLLAGVQYSTHRYHEGALVAFRGDRYERLLIIVSGTLSAEIVDLKGRVLKMESLKAPSIVASGILFADGNELPVALRAETDAVLLSLPRKTVLRLCAKSEAFLTAYLRDAGNRITFLAEKIHLFRFHTLRQKIAVYFLELRDRQGTPLLTLPYTVETLAELFGVSRPSLSRSLSELVDAGILSRSDRSYRIEDMDRLYELASDGE